MTLADYVVLAAYGSLLLEIGVFPIASEASVLQLVGGRERSSSPALLAARSAAMPLRVLRYLVPTAICILLFF